MGEDERPERRHDRSAIPGGRERERPTAQGRRARRNVPVVHRKLQGDQETGGASRLYQHRRGAQPADKQYGAALFRLERF
ncbi:hypothetical protein MOX02_34030 [Methylobacterium oxalidis]|uniref:Uncharacterized protein n=1 Tax=Methylobacterium oxalidis TaxID=944322 RepID=A0A512J5X8_9HYPH|nr:hypothetical protein MOX02_34030 [Methylobacterium oxalidis]GLS63497.1 hypothetical protein GCM10007888_18780 [Methylobacterium oxalidis]